jgi:hypothetical protein
MVQRFDRFDDSPGASASPIITSSHDVEMCDAYCFSIISTLVLPFLAIW